jgi:adenylate cyclase
MASSKSLLDRWLRPAGAALIILFGLSLIVLSVVMREGGHLSDEKRSSLLGRGLISSAIVENWFYDLRTKRFYDHDLKSPNIVILEITDESLNQIGRWPWTRKVHAEVVDRLRVLGAKVVMFDALFPEPESKAADEAFAASIKRFTDAKGAVVIGYGLADDPANGLPDVPDALLSSMISGSPGSEPMGSSALVDRNNFTNPALAASAANFGFITATADIDGVFRHAQLANEINKIYFPALGLSGFMNYYQNGKERSVELAPAEGSNDYMLKLKDGDKEHLFRLNRQGELKIRFFGRANSFVRVPVEEVYKDANPAANEELKRIFAGKAVLIGSSAFGAHDLRHLPTDAQSPGMYIHANLFHALDQNLLYQPDDRSFLISLALFLLGTITVLLLSRLKNPGLETAGTFGVLALIYGADYFYFAPEGYFLRLFFVLAGTISLYAWFTFLNVFAEAREKKKIRDAFSRYVAPEIVKEMLSNPDKLKVGGEKREITMLFSDVRDFTTISERLTAQELSTLLNIYMGRMTDILFESGGTLDKYIGDAMVGFWGAPLELKDHAYHAVRGAKLMLEALPEVNAEFERRKFPRVNVGIGLNTGEASVGNMGSDKIFQYTALGDNMNLASRLESLTKYYGVNLMISEFTLAKLGDRAKEFKLRPLDLVQVKGKSKAVKIFEVIPDWSPWAKETALLAKFCASYEQDYLGRRFEKAKAGFTEVLRIIPEDKATLKLLHTTEEFLLTPPPAEWDGVTVFTSK